MLPGALSKFASAHKDDEGCNKALQTLIFEARGKSLPKPYPLKRATG